MRCTSAHGVLEHELLETYWLAEEESYILGTLLRGSTLHQCGLWVLRVVGFKGCGIVQDGLGLVVICLQRLSAQTLDPETVTVRPINPKP